MTPEWLMFGGSMIAWIVGIAMFMGANKTRSEAFGEELKQFRESFERLEAESRADRKEFVSAIGTLTTNDAVNLTQHDGMSRRIDEILVRLGRQGAAIVSLRTRTHTLANWMHMADPGHQPKWPEISQNDDDL